MDSTAGMGSPQRRRPGSPQAAPGRHRAALPGRASPRPSSGETPNRTPRKAAGPPCPAAFLAFGPPHIRRGQKKSRGRRPKRDWRPRPRPGGR
ncbi:MAG: hypothetical protein LBP92_12535 [Deltaproteobacteria bacterium]|nr:hypothetical protein [Deltaproteobacteria bacterium]